MSWVLRYGTRVGISASMHAEASERWIATKESDMTLG